MNFPDSCSIEPAISNDGYDPTYGTAITSECRYTEASENTTGGSGLVFSAWLGLPPGTTITPASRITLTDGSKPPIVKIRDVKRLSDNEIEYIRVTLGISSERGGV
ncbi:MAG: hypothetical protein PHG06_00340 [Parabacteroides sp.]|nr:hypothetical protein [Parabacteroides sp.]